MLWSCLLRELLIRVRLWCGFVSLCGAFVALCIVLVFLSQLNAEKSFSFLILLRFSR